jgi:hypothetical protein
MGGRRHRFEDSFDQTSNGKASIAGSHGVKARAFTSSFEKLDNIEASSAPRREMARALSGWRAAFVDCALTRSKSSGIESATKVPDPLFPVMYPSEIN